MTLSKSSCRYMRRIPGDLYPTSLPESSQRMIVVGWTPRYAAASLLLMYLRVITNRSIPRHTHASVLGMIQRHEDLLTGSGGLSAGTVRPSPPYQSKPRQCERRLTFGLRDRTAAPPRPGRGGRGGAEFRGGFMHNWMDRAVCRGHDPELFFPQPWDSTRAAKAVSVCRTCPVMAECHTYRKRINAHTGIWHGEWFRPTTREYGDVRREALGMAVEGAPVEVIASELEVPAALVQNWLTREQKRLAKPGARPLRRSASVVIGGESD